MTTFPSAAILSFFVLPDDGLEPVLQPINAAQRTLDFYIYKFTNDEIKAAIAAAVRRGVQVRAVVERAPGNEPQVGAAAFRDLQKIGVDARWRPDYFVKSHAKSFVVDGALALISTFNFVDNWRHIRDHGISTADPAVIRDLTAAFAADWAQQPLANPPALPLVLSPVNSRATVQDLVAAAQREIVIEHEQFTDAALVTLLGARAAAGIAVRLISNHDDDGNAPSIARLQQLAPGVAVAYSHDLHLHTKLLIVDGSIMLVGSINLTAESLDQRREASILVADAVALSRANLLLDKDFRAGKRG